MESPLCKEVIETATHYIGESGKEYPIDEYINHGFGGIYKGFKDLPKEDYPYTRKYEVKKKWAFCRNSKQSN